MQQHITTKGELIHYFLNPLPDELRCPEGLAKNLDAILNLSLTSKELALTLFHAGRGAQNKVYGPDIPEAISAIESRLQKWTDKAMRSNRNDYSPYTIAHMFHGFSLIALRPPERFTEFALDLADKHIKEFNAEDMTFFLTSIATLGLPLSDKMLRGIANRTGEIKSALTAHQCHDVVWSLAILDSVCSLHRGPKRFQMNSVFSSLIANPIVRGRLASLGDISHHNMLSDSILWFKGETPSPRHEDMTPPTLLEQDISAALKKAGAIINPPVDIPSPKHRIDLSASFNRQHFYVECDGPYHHVRGTDDHKVYLNGPTLFQTALISRACPDKKILRIPIDVFYQRMVDQEFWENVLVYLDDAKDGSYNLANDGYLTPLYEGRDRLPT